MFLSWENLKELVSCCKEEEMKDSWYQVFVINLLLCVLVASNKNLDYT